MVMLGTNDAKERFGANAACIGFGMERLVAKAKTVEAWRGGKPNILVICPPHIGDGILDHPFIATMGRDSLEKTRELAPCYRDLAERQGCAFLDAEGIAEFNRLDCMHLTCRGHRQLAEALAALVPELVK